MRTAHAACTPLSGRGRSWSTGFEELRDGTGRQVRHVRCFERSFYGDHFVVGREDRQGFEFLREIPRQTSDDFESQRVAGPGRNGFL